MSHDTARKIAVMQAFNDGSKIEFKAHHGKEWHHNPSPSWNWDTFEYRVKEEPKVSQEDQQKFAAIRGKMTGEPKWYREASASEFEQELLTRWTNQTGYKKHE